MNRNNFTQKRKHSTVTAPCKADDFSELKIRLKITTRTLFFSCSCLPPPLSLSLCSQPPPYSLWSVNRRFAVSAWQSLISAGGGLPAFSRTRSEERDDGLRVVKSGESPPVWEYIPLALTPTWIPKAKRDSKWVESTGCYRSWSSHWCVHYMCPQVSLSNLLPETMSNLGPYANLQSAVRYRALNRIASSCAPACVSAADKQRYTLFFCSNSKKSTGELCRRAVFLSQS